MARERARRDIRVAVVHDWLTGMRGGEVVLEAILDLYPDADLFTLLHNRGTVSRKISDRTIHTSFVDRLPLKKKRYRHYLPLFPLAIESFDFHGYDLIVSSSHCVARGIIPPPGVPHVCYFHSPMRYVWDMFYEYFPRQGFLNRFVIPVFAHYLRQWDYSTRDRVDAYVCNSAFVAERIRRYYGKESIVVHPPCVASDDIQPITKDREDFYLVVSALVPYKRIDIAIEAFRTLPNERLVVIGKGPEERSLRRTLPGNVQMKGSVDREEIADHYRRAKALIFPGEEDFGIVPVEAQSFGCPVLAYGRGGALETVRPGKTGDFFFEQTSEALGELILATQKKIYKANDFRMNCKRFTTDTFYTAFQRATEYAMKAPGSRSGRKKSR